MNISVHTHPHTEGLLRDRTIALDDGHVVIDATAWDSLMQAAARRQRMRLRMDGFKVILEEDEQAADT